jgi:isopentenyl diphosphate isomerase/L-lactate dehydrogenase-like FMN-dependent dehydrogenase
LQLTVCFDVQMTAFGDYQLEIYLAGLQGVLPSFPMAFAELEAQAERTLPPSVLSYVVGGAGSEHTQRANVSAFAQWGLIPRMFVGAARRDLSVELFGRPYAYGLALGGADGIVHVLRSILAETDLIMAVDGYPTRADLTRDTLRRTCTCPHD